MKTKLFLLLFCLPIVIQAQQVEWGEAMIAGKNAILNNNEKPDPELSVEKIYTLQDEETKNVLLYEVVMKDRQAVLLSGYKMCLPVLGYFHSEGTSILDSLSRKVPDGLKSLIKGYAEQVKMSFKEDFEENEYNKTWQELIKQEKPLAPPVEIVSPLLKSKWNQSLSNDYIDCEAYNYYVEKTSKHCDYCSYSISNDPSKKYKCTTGCTAVAMAQVMYYWKYPMQYDWCNMEDSLAIDTAYCRRDTINSQLLYIYDPVNNPDPVYVKHRDAVAKLIFDAAESSIGTDYCFGATCQTTALPSAIARSLRNNFSYHSDANFHWKSSHTMDKWKKMLKEDLNNRRPVIYGSLGLHADAHCFVCDGYRSDDRFHFNFGWGGSSHDGWYKLDYIRFACEKNSGTPYTCIYDVSEYAVFNIYPKDNFDHCKNDLTVSNDITFTLFKPILSHSYLTTLTIDINNGTATINSGENIAFKAHEAIYLKHNFHAKSGSKFRAYTEPCANCPKTGAPNHAPGKPNAEWKSEDEVFYNVSNTESSIFVYPNPTTGIVSIEVLGNMAIQSISVFDVLGKTLQSNIAFAGNTLDLSYLSNGIYFIKIQTLSGQTTHKVIIQK